MLGQLSDARKKEISEELKRLEAMRKRIAYLMEIELSPGGNGGATPNLTRLSEAGASVAAMIRSVDEQINLEAQLQVKQANK